MKKTDILTEQNIKIKTKEFIKNNFLLGSELRNLNDDDSFFKKGIIDSTGVLELVSFVEATFGIKVEDEELMPDNFDSVNKVVIFITKKKSARE
jgi:acyl carrier protein